MHYNVQGITEDSYLRQRQQDHRQQQSSQQHASYAIRQKARDRSCSPRSDEVRSPVSELRGETVVGSPENARFAENGSPSGLGDESRMSRYREENDAKRPSFSKQENESAASFFREADDTGVKCFTEEMVSAVASHYRESNNSPGRISPQEYAVHSTDRRHSSFGKTSFCIDALLGRATGKQESLDHERSERNQRFLFTTNRNTVIDASPCLTNSLARGHDRESSCTLGGASGAATGTNTGIVTGIGNTRACTGAPGETDATTGVGIAVGVGVGNGTTLNIATGRSTEEQRTSSLGGLLNPFDRSVVQHGLASPSSLQVIRDASDRQDIRERPVRDVHLPGVRVETAEETMKASPYKGENVAAGIGNGVGFRVDRLENIEDDGSIDVDPARTGSASSGSNASHSPISSPPISPGSEEPGNNAGIPGNPNLPSGHYSALGGNAGVARQNQALLLHPSSPLIHPGGLYYHPAGGSAFHSIHKEGQPVGHSQSAHPQQHHIHPLQLEWLARTGMLYPRLPADLAGESAPLPIFLPARSLILSCVSSRRHFCEKRFENLRYFLFLRITHSVILHIRNISWYDIFVNCRIKFLNAHQTLVDSSFVTRFYLYLHYPAIHSFLCLSRQ